MKPNKPYKIRDRFKGFAEEPELCPVLEKRVTKNYDSLFSKMIEEMYNSTIIMKLPSDGGLPIRSSIAFDKMPIYNGIDMNSYIIDETESWSKECEHEPIDVGFTNPRMVCKKCDKDLK